MPIINKSQNVTTNPLNNNKLSKSVEINKPPNAPKTALSSAQKQLALIAASATSIQKLKRPKP